MNRPFVVSVASEKGGVGKTTIATNLAVYLKALHEDLPVTIASFDNHFSVDQMFALGARPAMGVADLLLDDASEDLSAMGQYGVQYLASAKRLQAPDHPPAWLKQRLYNAVTDGVLILDTRPILDWFTEAALLAADLVIVPVKDRAALVNAASLRDILIANGKAERLWLLPSLVDSRARLNAEVRVHEFLAYAAKERDYQVLDLQISKSPKVEGLASGFSSAVKPVLTHARNTAVHGQFKQLAEFVLHQIDTVRCSAEASSSSTALGQSRTVTVCPVCRHSSETMPGHFFFHLGSRRRGLIHQSCMESFCSILNVEDDDQGEILALTLFGPGLVAPENHLARHSCGGGGELFCSEAVALSDYEELPHIMEVLTGCSMDEAYRELVVISRAAATMSDRSWPQVQADFMILRRKITRELRESGLY